MAENTKRCRKCGQEKPLSQFSPQRQCRDGVRGTCKTCASTFSKAWQKSKKASLRGYLDAVMVAARNRAKAANVPFDLSLDRMIELWETQQGRCAVSGLSFQRGKSKWFRNPYNPSHDRIVPSLGYVHENVRFVLDAGNVALNEWGLDALLPVFQAVVAKNIPETNESTIVVDAGGNK